MRACYLNNSGSRWVTYDDNGQKTKITLTTKLGKEVTRVVQFWQQFGNFATARISYKGKAIDVFPDTILED